MKKLIGLTIILIILGTLLIAANPWKARLVIINKTEQTIHITMEYPYTWLRAPYIEPDTKNINPKTVFTIDRDVYKNVEITACGKTAVGTMDLNRNLKLTFTSCDQMIRSDKPQYLGEPSMEKPNWFKAPGMANWQWKFTPPSKDK